MLYNQKVSMKSEMRLHRRNSVIQIVCRNVCDCCSVHYIHIIVVWFVVSTIIEYSTVILYWDKRAMDRWTDRVVLVTGASSGIGRSIVVELSKYPLKIVAVARRIDLIQVLTCCYNDVLSYIGILDLIILLNNKHNM